MTQKLFTSQFAILSICLFKFVFGLELHSQHCILVYGKKVNKSQPIQMSSPINYPAYLKLYFFGSMGFSNLSVLLKGLFRTGYSNW